VLPEFLLFTKELKPVPLEAQQTYYLVVIGNNREPELPADLQMRRLTGAIAEGILHQSMF
jgi:hypothetical protein